MIYQGKARYPVSEVVLHTSATPTGWYEGRPVDDMVAEIRRWHVDERGWSDIGYHRVVAPDGSIGIGRSLYRIGAHVMGHNRGTVGVCMVPVKTIEKMGRFEDFYTPAQRKAVKDYIEDLAELAGQHLVVSGHNQYANKLCPGFKVRSADWTC